MTPFGHSLPSLNGNSYHGSKPTTALSRTFSLMPHCCPQKQQWVLTTRSTSSPASQPPGRRLVEVRTVAGDQLLLGDRRAGHQPKPSDPRRLGEGDLGPPAARAGVLVVAAVVERVVEADLGQHGLEVGDLLGAGERLAATPAHRRRAVGVGPLVVGDAEVARPLEDVEQLAERDVHQPEDDGEGVDRVERRVEVPVEPHARHGEEQPGDRHREQAGEGEEVVARARPPARRGHAGGGAGR